MPCNQRRKQKKIYTNGKEIIVKILFLFLAQLTLDSARIFSSQMSFFCSTVYNDILTVATWVVFYIIIVNRFIVLNFLKHKRFFLLCAAAVILAFLFVTCGNYKDARTLASMSEKYISSVSQIEDCKINAIFSSQLRNMFLDSVVGIAMLICSSETKEFLHFSKQNILGKYVARCISFFVIVLFLGGMKSLLLPYSAIGGFELSSSGCYSHQDDGSSYLNTTFSIYRMCSYDPSDIEICCVWTGTRRW